MNFSLKKLLLFGVMAEVIIFFFCHLTQPSLEETFRLSARYSGRLSFGVFLVAFYRFAFGHPKQIKENTKLHHWLILFAVVHVIHFGFLATNVILNEIPIVPLKLAGGALAYLMIVLAPLVLHKLKLGWQLVYFYYVSLVMAITYLARAKGDFEGAEPFWFHYLALGVLILASLFFGYKIFKTKREIDSKP
ncbi:hypothetical protein [Croceitalea rosinachiae]|uniref:Ferric oxidoreductase domain-containing protein n=1 Tax=Croceitalea rosinachiae TaxID=3075596 RepID=A0ABU3A9G4_9FLAO|nr:hypothetical protein [Croceitalea sp. F388]MDT0606834.1 hypothetical protein [Croceitalea sp. F388]